MTIACARRRRLSAARARRRLRIPTPEPAGIPPFGTAPFAWPPGERASAPCRNELDDSAPCLSRHPDAASPTRGVATRSAGLTPRLFNPDDQRFGVGDRGCLVDSAG